MSVELEIVSPTKLVLSRAVDMVVMPGYEGDIAAMEKHAPMIILLRGGVITLHEGGQATDRFFVGGGFAEITPDRCTILADDAVPVSELSAQAMDTVLADAERAWGDVDKFDSVARDAVLDRLQSARAGVAAAKQAT
jgi:F-type H+-transporting ATPase subunit epsilon